MPDDDLSIQLPSKAHRFDGMNHFGAKLWPDGLVPWLAAAPPNLTGEQGEERTGRLRACAYCGSMHPADVAAAIKAGAVGSWADRKYGWPHKAYFDNIPNPYAGMLESRACANFEDPRYPRRVQSGYDSHTGQPTYMYFEEGRPAAALTGGKFYSIHLLDASPEDRAVIEQHLGLAFTFEGNGEVSWKPTHA